MGKILVIEDHADTLEALYFFLTASGFSVVTATDGREGLAATYLERPDLIISDVSMPNLDGIEMVKLIRMQPQFKDLPVIVYTAYGVEMRKKALLAGANRTMEKPLDPNSLVGLINELLSQSASLSCIPVKA